MTISERYRFYRRWHGRPVAFIMAADSAVVWGAVAGVSVVTTLCMVLR